MDQLATMNQAQLQILDMLSFIKTPEALQDLNKVISDYFVQKADAELDRMWNEDYEYCAGYKLFDYFNCPKKSLPQGVGCFS